MSYGLPPEPEPTTTASNSMKIFLAVVGVFLVVCFLCCGGLLVGSWWLGAKAVDKVKQVAERSVLTSNDPVVVDEQTQRIVAMQPVQGMQPRQYYELSNPFNDKLVMSVSTYEDQQHNTVLMICEFGQEYAGSIDPEQLRREVEKSLREQGEETPGELNPREVKTVPTEVNGEPASFVVLRGTAEQQSNGEPQVERVVVQGSFQTERGAGFLLMEGPGEHLTDAEIDRFIESLE